MKKFVIFLSFFLVLFVVIFGFLSLSKANECSGVRAFTFKCVSNK